MNEIIRPPSREQFRNAPQGRVFDAVLAAGGNFDPDVWHIIDRRDNSLIADEILHGAGSSKFVYSFEMPGSGTVSGISVVGARHLAAHYGGIKHRMVATMQKTGSLFVFTSYPAENIPMSVSCSTLPELLHEPDFFQAVCEVSDVKKGNTIQVEKRESRWETKRDGSSYERRHYEVIAQSKAYRNAVLALIPQDVQLEWKQRMLQLGKNETITSSVIEEKRSNILRFAASKAIPLERGAVEALTMDQIAGLADAAREGKLPQFAAAAQALGMMTGELAEVRAEPERPTKVAIKSQPKQEPPKAEAPKAEPTRAEPAKADQARDEPSRADPAKPEVDCYLSDAYGEPTEWQGRNQFTDATAFAEALLGIWAAAPADTKRAIVENNADAITDASAASDRARGMLAQLAAPSEEKIADPWVLPVPTNGRGSDLVGYIAAARAKLETLGSEDQVSEWEAANAPTYGKFPSTKRLEMQKAVEERRQALRKPTEPFAAERAGRLYLGDIRVSTAQGLEILERSPAFQRCLAALDGENPDLKGAIVMALKARRDELRAGRNEPPPNMGDAR